MSDPPLPSITTPLCSLLSIRHPILLAGMAHTSTAPLAAAVSNAGGLGVIGGLGYTPSQLREMIHELKALLSPPGLPFGVDLALPSLEPGARKTNHDYTRGQLDALIEVVVEEGARLFVSAVGVPPERVVRKLHAGGVVVMNMAGLPRHAEKAFGVGVDIVCAQGGEGGGHTGDVAGNILVPACVDVARRFKPKMLGGREGLVVAAGGIWDGRGLAAALMMGAVGVWIGTRFVATPEAACSSSHKAALLSTTWGDTVRTLVVSGRPLRVKRNEYIASWESREQEALELTRRGVVPMERDLDFEAEEGAGEGPAGVGLGVETGVGGSGAKGGGEGNAEGVEVEMPYLMGQVAAVIEEVKPAREIVEEIIRGAGERLMGAETMVRWERGRESKL